MSRNLEAVLQPGPVQWLVASDKDSKACSALAPPAPARTRWAGKCSLAAEEDKEWTSVEPFEVEEFCEEVVKKKEVIK